MQGTYSTPEFQALADLLALIASELDPAEVANLSDGVDDEQDQTNR